MSSRPKEVIFILGEEEIRNLEYDSIGRKLLSNDDILVISIDKPGSTKTVANIKLRGLFQRGLVLIKSPYEDENYEEITNAGYGFAIEKYMYFSQFCNLLGAKEVTVQRLDKIMKTGSKSLEFLAKLPPGQQKLLVKDEELRKFESSIHLKDNFQGGEPKLVEAESILRDKKLLGDVALRSLLEIRQQSNLISARQLTLNLSKETKRIIEIAGKIKPPKFLSEIVASFEYVEKNLAEYTLTLEVKF